MRNIFILFVLLVCVACERTTREGPTCQGMFKGASDDESNGPSQSVMGTWELVNSDIPGENVLELKADGSGSIKIRMGERKEEYTVKWIRDGDKIYLAAEGEKEVGVYEVVSADGKTLVLSIDGDLHYFKKKSSNIFSREEEKEEESENDDIFGGHY